MIRATAVLSFFCPISLVAAQGPVVDPTMHLPGLTQSAEARVTALATLPNGSVVFGSNAPAGVPGRMLSLTGFWDGRAWKDFAGGIRSTAVFARPSWVAALLPLGNSLIAGGRFAVQDDPSIRNIALWNGSKWVAMGSISSWVHCLAVYKNEVYAGGEFQTADGARAYGIARWNGSKWIEVGGGVSRSRGQPNGIVRALLPAADGTLWVGGTFDRAGSVAATNIARWNGTSWSAVPGAVLAHRNRSSTIHALAEFGGKVHAGGDFSFQASNGKRYSGIAVHDGRNWNPVGGSIQGGGPLRALAVFRGSLYAGGNFVLAGGVPAWAIARWDGTRWHHVGDARHRGSPGLVLALHAAKDRLYVGGQFYTVGLRAPFTPVGASKIASFDGRTWREVGPPGGSGSVGVPTAMAAMGAGFVLAGPMLGPRGSAAAGHLHHFDGTFWRSLNAGDVGGGSIGALITYRGDVIAGGSFFTIGGKPYRNVARWDGRQWNAMGRSGIVRSFLVLGGNLYMLGGFLKRWTGTQWQQVGLRLSVGKDMVVYRGRIYVAGQKSLAASERLFEWDGKTMRAVPGAPTGDRIESLTVYDGELVVAGDFQKAGGGLVTAPGVAKWNGTRWAPVGKGLPVRRGAPVFEVRAAGPYLFARGSFSLHKGLAYFDGRAWQSLAGGMHGPTSAMYVDPVQQDLYILGQFTGARNGVPAHNIVRFHTLAPWRDLGKGHWVARPARSPLLTAAGRLDTGSLLSFRVRNAAPSTAGIHVFGTRRLDLPFFGGTLVPSVDLHAPFSTDAFGGATLTLQVPPPGIPRGTPLYVQDWFVDARAPAVLGASNAVVRTAP